MIHVVIIRHGRTAWNEEAGRGERFRGMLDVPLAPEGVTQARVTAHHLSNWHPAAIYTSPLQRAARTAEIIAAPHHLVAQRLNGLRSMNYGDWAGKLHSEVARDWPELYTDWRRDPFSIRIPGGESAADLRDRALQAVRTVVGHHGDGETLLFVTHQVVTKVLACGLLELPDPAYWQIRQDLCNLSRYDYDPETRAFDVVCLNDTCHLTPALAQAREHGTRIILIRHGQTTWNAGAGEERFRGREDLPLDKSGRAQAQAVADWLAAEPIAGLYTSPLLRARQTLEPLAEAQGLPMQVSEGLIDIDYGRFQGLTHAEARREFPDLYALWRAAPGQVHFPDGEALAHVQARLVALVADLLQRHPGQTVALVGHEVVNRVMVCTLLGLDLDHIRHIRQDNGGIDVFQHDGERWTVLSLNDTCHLPAPSPTEREPERDAGPRISAEWEGQGEAEYWQE